MWIGSIWLKMETSNEHSGFLKGREFINELLCFMDSFGFLHYNLTAYTVNICYLAFML
jgi:hypothetical protein